MKLSRRLITIFSLALVFSLSLGIIYLKGQYVVPILMYHKIDDGYMNSKLSVSPESFARQMQFLRKNKYNVVSLKKLTEMIKSGRYHVTPNKTNAPQNLGCANP